MQYKAYYQWVPFVLFLQACVFYTPHALFKLAEGGKVASIISGLHHKGDTLSYIHTVTVDKFIYGYLAKTLT